MRHIFFLTFCLLTLLLCAGPATADEEKPKLAVMTLEDRSGDISPALVDDLTDYLRTQIARRGTFVVIDKSRQAEALRKLVGAAKKESYQACYDENCQIPLGQALSADTVLRVKLSRIGSTYQLTAEVVDLAKEAVEAGAAASVEIAVNPKNGREDRLLQGMRAIAHQIAGEMPGGAGETINIGGTGGDYGMITTGGGAGEGDGIVKFESTPTAATVEVGGRRLPKVTPVQEFLGLGKQRVKIFGHEGYEVFDQKVDLRAGQTLRVNLRPVVGNVVVRPRDKEGSLLTGVAVFIDGEEVAKAPVRIQGVRTGRRNFRFETPGMRPVTQVVKVRQSDTVDVEVRMETTQGVLRVDNLTIREGRTTQKGLSAQVLVDGEARGNTPLEVSLTPGKHEVVVRHKMARETSFSVNIADGRIFSLKPTLPAANSPDWDEFVSGRRAAQRTGTFFWLSIASSAPGRIVKLTSMEETPISEGIVWQTNGTGKFTRAVQFLTYGIAFEGNYLGLRLYDSIIDLGFFKADQYEDANAVMGVSIMTNPTLELSFRPTPMFPFRLDGDAEFYWAWSSDNSEDGLSMKSLTASGHLTWEVWQDYVVGRPCLSVSAGARWFRGWGHLDYAKEEAFDFKGSALMYGGNVQYIYPLGDDSGLFLGAGYYTGDGNKAWLWTIDWRGSTGRKKK